MTRLVVVLLVFAVAACGSREETPNPAALPTPRPTPYEFQPAFYHDALHHVSCWYYETLVCIPDKNLAP